jgi:malonyl-CoA/methylmalonyl-CoA synthetase
VFSGYLAQPEKTAEALTPDHAMRSGDLGHLDRDGYLFLVGRAKELIITGGLNVYPKEVEQACETHPSVREVAVAGVPDADLGEAVVAAVVLDPRAPVGVRELQEHLRARLAPYKCPKRIAFVAALPRNAMGKVEKARVAALPELRA